MIIRCFADDCVLHRDVSPVRRNTKCCKIIIVLADEIACVETPLFQIYHIQNHLFTYCRLDRGQYMGVISAKSSIRRFFLWRLLKSMCLHINDAYTSKVLQPIRSGGVEGTPFVPTKDWMSCRGQLCRTEGSSLFKSSFKIQTDLVELD